ncbi:carbohydrate ABC transporter permease [Phototrophicus methaneseepsis]|uniref:Carbohydrate ABC transporter permease n=1 Tax=Phototrophicus methaneseepsis TaxID=2710758 RepID=A0A7S8ID97_9CHLR|nr:carbohydrate ABC transporter permease [Phototrophicus methaneseepsis]QPC81316.1 carbohydrate ABC transporter permease [Phototrophicus methaneseepsis]
MATYPQEQARPAVRPTLSERLRGLVPERWYIHVLLWIVCFIIGFPLFYAILVATQTNSDIYAYRFLPGSSLPENWNVVMNIAKLGGYMVNSLFIAIVVTVGKVVLSLLAGLAFVYFRFPGKWLVFGFVLITLMMPTEILILALFRLVNSLGWGNTYLALIVPFLASATGSFLFRQHFANIPSELSEAAQLDGATPMQFLLRILIPISWNTIGALTVIQFVYVWNFYIWPVLIINGQERQVVQVGLRTLMGGDTQTRYGPMMLGAVIASIPPVIVFLLLQKQFMSGFTLTRDK